MSVQQLIQEIYTSLNFHKTLGVDHYPASEELARFLQLSSPNKCSSPAAEICPPVTPRVQTNNRVTPAPQPAVVSQQTQRQPIDLKTADLCAQCSLGKKRLGFVDGKGGDTVRLLVVGDWLIGDAEGSQNSVFGAEQDVMLSRMFAAMKLPESDVFVTNIVKCSLPETIRPEREEISTCVQLLYRQIARLRPQLICTMGTVASQTLLGKTASLSQLRGKFYQIEFADGLIIPVLATYHPSYLLKNAEMKRPAWDDLQKVIQRLAAKK